MRKGESIRKENERERERREREREDAPILPDIKPFKCLTKYAYQARMKPHIWQFLIQLQAVSKVNHEIKPDYLILIQMASD